MATIIAPATGLLTKIPDAEAVETTPEVVLNTEDASTGNTPFRVEIVGYNKLAPPPHGYDEAGVNQPSVRVMDTMTVTAPRQYPVKNPLLDYDSYTYGLSLHGCSIEDYNNLVGNPDGFVPKQVLIANAGRYGDTFPRNKYFQKTDFFFDDFRMSSVINTTTRNKFSNVIDLKFTIVEPLGFTFIKRIMLACMAPDGGINSPNYLKQPFILQIDFFGYKDGNEVQQFDSLADAFGDDTKTAPSLKDHTKFLPIIFTEVKSRVTTKGTEYQISAAPYNHMAFSPTKVVTPADFSVKAATVQDIFGKGFEISTELVDASQREQNDIAAGRELADAFGPGTVVNQTGYTTTFADAGLCDKINAWNEGLKQKTQRIPDKFRVEFDPIIGNSPIEAGRVADVGSVAQSGTDKNSTQQAAGAKKSVINFSNQTINIPAGTSIGAVVEFAILNSKWFQETNIYNDSTAGGARANQGRDQRAAILNAFKIIPKIKVNAYDPSRADYSYEVVFQVKRWLANSKAPNAAQGRTPGWVKEYNYYYSGGARSLSTGQFTDNKDVIDLQIDFNTLYYAQLTAFKGKASLQNTGGSGLGLNSSDSSDLTSASTTGKSGSGSPELNPAKKEQQGVDGLKSTSDALTNFSLHYISKNSRSQTLNGTQQAARIAAADILNTQIIDIVHGDMINVNLKIIGDPTFIKQDDIFYNSGLSYATDILTKNQSLRTDDSELYVFLTFRTPEDYDESTGLAIPGQNKFAYTEFTGVYKIITIDSQFSRGKFEQTLSLARLTTSDEKLNVEKLNDNRIESLLLAGAGQTTRFPSTLAFGPRIIQSTFSGGTLNGLATGLLNYGIGQVTNKIINEVSGPVSDAVKEIGNSLRETLTDFGNTIGGLFYDNSNGIPTDFTVVGDFGIGEDLGGAFNDLTTSVTNLPTFEVDPFGGGGLI